MAFKIKTEQVLREVREHYVPAVESVSKKATAQDSRTARRVLLQQVVDLYGSLLARLELHWHRRALDDVARCIQEL